jgi:hypothetical protein
VREQIRANKRYLADLSYERLKTERVLKRIDSNIEKMEEVIRFYEADLEAIVCKDQLEAEVAREKAIQAATEAEIQKRVDAIVQANAQAAAKTETLAEITDSSHSAEAHVIDEPLNNPYPR